MRFSAQVNCVKKTLAVMAFSLGAFACAQSSHADESLANAAPRGLVLKPPHIPDQVPSSLRAVNEMLSKEVSPTDNAVVLLVEVFGEEAFEPSLRQASLEMLGIGHLAEQGRRFVYAEQFVQLQEMTTPGGTGLKSRLLEQQMYECSERPWTAKEFPALSAYLAANQTAMNAIVSASQKLKYYAPMLADTDPPRLLSASLVIERRLPYLAHALTARAMLRFEQQEFALAVNDLSACHRIALLLATGSPFDVSTMKAHYIDGIANRAAVAMLESGHLTGEQARLYLAEMQQVAALPPASSAADRGERAILHQEIEFLRFTDETLYAFFDLPDEQAIKAPLSKTKLSDIRFDLVLERADEVHDTFVHALSIPSHRDQIVEFQKLDRDYITWVDKSEETSRELLDKSNGDLAPISRWIGETMAMSLRPWYWQRRVATDRMQTRRDLVKLGMSLNAFHDDDDRYPAALSDLVPRYLPDVPLDSYSDVAFTYRRLSAHHAQLTSWGANHQNDAGHHFNDDHHISLRRPDNSKLESDQRLFRCQGETQ